MLPGLEPDKKLIWTYFEAMVPERIPQSLLVVGSGAIGIEFASFYRTLGAEVTVVFDGGTVGPIPTRLPLGPVEVVFTDAGRTADDEIEVRTNAAPPERPVVVVTSDNELRSRVAALGATVTRSPALLGLATAR